MDGKHFDELAIALSRKRALKLLGASVLALFLPGVAEARNRNLKPCPPGTVRKCRPRKGRHPGGQGCRCKRVDIRRGFPPIRPGVCRSGQHLCGPVCCPNSASVCVSGYCVCPPEGCPDGTCCYDGYLCVSSCPGGEACVSGVCRLPSL